MRRVLPVAGARARLAGGPGERASLPLCRSWIAPIGATLVAAAIACGGAGGDDRDAPVRIAGEVDEPAGGPLWAPVDLAVTADRVWVADAGAGLVHGYDHDGRHRVTIGRKGRGPGELLDPLALGVSGDSLWVLNTGNRRIEWFGLDGGTRESVPLGDSVPPLVDLVRFHGRWYGTSPFGSAPVLRLASRRGELAIDHGLGGPLAARVELEAAPRVQAVYRLAVAGGHLWALHAYLPLAASFDHEERLVELVAYPGPSIEGGRVERRTEGGRTRRVRSAPENPAGALGVLETDTGLLLLSRQRSSDGRQRMFPIDGPSDPVRPRLGAPGVFLLAAERVGSRTFATGTRGEVDEPAVFLLEPRPGKAR